MSDHKRSGRKRKSVEVEEEVDVCTKCNSLISFCVCPDSCFTNLNRAATLSWTQITQYFRDAFHQNSAFSVKRVYLNVCENSYNVGLYKKSGLIDLLLLDAILYLSSDAEATSNSKQQADSNVKGRKATRFDQSYEFIKALEKEHKRVNSSRARKKETLGLIHDISHPWSSIANMRKSISSCVKKGAHEEVAKEVIVKIFNHKLLEHGDLQKLLHSATSMLCSETREPLAIEEFSLLTESSRDSYPYPGVTNSYNDTDTSTYPINDSDSAPLNNLFESKRSIGAICPAMSSKTTAEDKSLVSQPLDVVLNKNYLSTANVSSDNGLNVVKSESDARLDSLDEPLSPCLVEIPANPPKTIIEPLAQKKQPSAVIESKRSPLKESKQPAVKVVRRGKRIRKAADDSPQLKLPPLASASSSHRFEAVPTMATFLNVKPITRPLQKVLSATMTTAAIAVTDDKSYDNVQMKAGAAENNKAWKRSSKSTQEELQFDSMTSFTYYKTSTSTPATPSIFNKLDLSISIWDDNDNE